MPKKSRARIRRPLKGAIGRKRRAALVAERRVRRRRRIEPIRIRPPRLVRGAVPRYREFQDLFAGLLRDLAELLGWAGPEIVDEAPFASRLLTQSNIPEGAIDPTSLLHLISGWRGKFEDWAPRVAEPRGRAGHAGRIRVLVALDWIFLDDEGAPQYRGQRSVTPLTSMMGLLLAELEKILTSAPPSYGYVAGVRVLLRPPEELRRRAKRPAPERKLKAARKKLAKATKALAEARRKAARQKRAAKSVGKKLGALRREVAKLRKALAEARRKLRAQARRKRRARNSVRRKSRVRKSRATVRRKRIVRKHHGRKK